MAWINDWKLIEDDSNARVWRSKESGFRILEDKHTGEWAVYGPENFGAARGMCDSWEEAKKLADKG